MKSKIFCKCFSSLIYIFAVGCVKAQDQTSQVKSQLFLEAGGPGFGISINYQPKFSADKNSNIVSGRIGIGGIGPIPGREKSGFLFTLPAGVQYRPGGKRLEFGTGITLFYLTNDGMKGPGFFLSAAWYPRSRLRILLSPIIANRRDIKYYFGIDTPILPFVGIAFILK